MLCRRKPAPVAMEQAYGAPSLASLKTAKTLVVRAMAPDAYPITLQIHNLRAKPAASSCSLRSQSVPRAFCAGHRYTLTGVRKHSQCEPLHNLPYRTMSTSQNRTCHEEVKEQGCMTNSRIYRLNRSGAGVSGEKVSS